MIKSKYALIIAGWMTALLSSQVDGGLVVVWQTAIPQSSGAFVQDQGYAQRLDLRCDVTLLPCKWQITTKVFIDDGNLGSYNLVIRDPVGSESNIRIATTSFAGSPFSNVETLFESPNGSFNGLLSNITATIPAGVGPVLPSTQFLHSYDLTMLGGQLGNVTNLIGDTNGFGGLDPPFPQDPERRVQMAANPALQLGPWPNPVIRIYHVPEPATLYLLASGLVLLGRRKEPRRKTAF